MVVCFSVNQSRAPVTLGKILSQQRRLKVCVHLTVASALVHRIPAAGEAHKNVLPGDARETPEKFGALKEVLDAIPAAYANCEVCQHPLFWNSPLTKAFSTGIHRCGKEDSSPPPAHSCIGSTFRFASR